MFTRQHFNAIAKDIRTELEPLVENYENCREANDGQYKIFQAQIRGITDLALRFARRFETEREENPNGYEFDVLKFLDACSPDKERYPFSELWMGVDRSD